METGKYYVDGEGFYKVLSKIEDKGKIVVDWVYSKSGSISRYSGLELVEEACDRRMVECTKEQFEKARDMADAAINKLYDYNTEVFVPLWKKREFNKKKETE